MACWFAGRDKSPLLPSFVSLSVNIQIGEQAAGVQKGLANMKLPGPGAQREVPFLPLSQH
jgi:hypothetical protein